MRSRMIRIIAALTLTAAVVFGLTLHVSALDDTYRFDDLEMSIKFPKSFHVITVNSQSDDEVFQEVELDYDETITAFKAADIYLRAYEPDMAYQISMTVTKNDNSVSVNNYADLTSAERKSIIETILGDDSVSTATEVKHNGNIFIDLQRQTAADGKTVYINQSNTIVNGMQIDLTLQKPDEEITPEEAKALTNAANSLSFDHVRRNTGPVFDWWRLLLWVVILAALAIAISFIYRQYNKANKRKLEERRLMRRFSSVMEEEAPAHAEELRPMTFDESLGYKDDEEFTVRAEADEMADSDIKVKDRDPSKGIAFFEDEGSGIDDGSDYFDTYFEEPTEKRAWYQRFGSAIATWLKMAAKHTGYFFKNLFSKLFKRRKK
ncbi:MAG: hypothetical protein IJH07_06215 [Ruminococcus sp.]|nr:hypothetical protein [Ruminococcus sp.]